MATGVVLRLVLATGAALGLVLATGAGLGLVLCWFLLFFVGTSLWLGTVLSLFICITSMAFGLFFRIRIEEKTLLEGLDGYEEYIEKVKFKLIPFVI